MTVGPGRLVRRPGAEGRDQGPSRLGRRPEAEGRDRAAAVAGRRESESAGPEAGAEGRDQKSLGIEVVMGGPHGCQTRMVWQGLKNIGRCEAQLELARWQLQSLLVRIKSCDGP